ncbi:protoheme IX farnesyltransferase [Saccharopolyspora antimicrobica]|uniref:Protoheme IX farnesyltransferase n=1 Tax=Saccharopolyspora antimicrobica TaxID=455193 RepID=A0A1I5E8Z2_9PSEU|nr:heme o synthase [Saccharopolyspora antimicrobica]RKT86714.1 protoheme IX farnesyltransferase [Saccharopolyspora antimicrobica]SFO07830.1 protoheme IX farnesyltransferase [Saccharopolyspora antimicrobica]
MPKECHVVGERSVVTTTADTSRERHARRPADLLKAYVGLIKPRVIELLLVTTIPAMLLAERGIPSPWLVIATLIGGTMAAGSANALNCVADADIDQVMKRTRARPLVRHTVSTRHALVFGIALGVGSFAWLWATANLLAASLAVGTILFYVFVYTLVLKRRTAQNIVWGGAAGCMPVVIGWAGVTGRIDWPALVMFGVIFFWTPPHTWSLAMKYKDDYERAGVPMLPVVAEPTYVSRQIVAYTWLMVIWTLLLVPATGWLYAAFAVLAGVWFLLLAHRLHAATKRGEKTKPMKLFHMSNTYLMIVFVALAVDSALGLPVLGWPF